MISNERMKRKSGPMGRQPIQDGSIGWQIEKVEMLNKQIGDEEEKVKRNVEISKEKGKNLKRQLTLIRDGKIGQETQGRRNSVGQGTQ